jgi:hypothetical protein
MSIERKHFPNIYSVLEKQPFNLIGMRYLQIGFGVAILFRVLTEFRYAEYFYGFQGVSVGTSQLTFGHFFGSLIDQIFRNEIGGYLFNIIRAVGAIGLILGRFPRVATLISLFCFLFEETTTMIGDGGDNIMRILLFYMLFMLSCPPALENKWKNYLVFFHNVAVIAMYVQICVLYFTSGAAKLHGDLWLQGTALYYITHTEVYGTSSLWLLSLLKNPVVVGLGAYLTIIYQIGFTFMLFNRAHFLWVILGIFLHMGIGVVMGLTSFSIAMISIILFTVTDREWRSLYGFVNFAWRLISTKWLAKEAIPSKSEA